MGPKGCLFLSAVVAVVSADGEQPGRPPGMLPGGRRKSTPIWHPTPEPLPVSVNGSEWRELDWQEGQAAALGSAVEHSPMLCRPPGRLPGMPPGGRQKSAPIWYPTPEPLPVPVNGSEWRELDWQEPGARLTISANA